MSAIDLARTGEICDRTGVLSVQENAPQAETSVPDHNESDRHDFASGSWSDQFDQLVNGPTLATQVTPAMARPVPDLGSWYTLQKKLGQGGMGAVYLGIDHHTQTRVAIKVLPPELGSDPAAAQRFQKEARLLAEVQHPHVANLLSVGRAGDVCYLVMELVEGTDLKGLLKHHGALPERIALQITADIASALSVAHQRGIVHRDLKPANVLLSAFVEEGESAENAVFSTTAAGQVPTVKLTDFGLARHVNQSASMQLTRSGAMLGTPYYIAPEQCMEKGAITPATDIYSLGATLFELLTGRPPFLAEDTVKLISMHCLETPPDLRKLNPEISDGAAALVARMLQKVPSERFADADHLSQELGRLLSGDVTSAVTHPVLPEPCGKVFEAVWTWDLQGAPRELWPYVSNTERVNAAVGLPSVEYTTTRDAHGQKHRLGTTRLGWAKLRWEEHPFEWVEGRRLSILREFQGGPFQWFLSVVELTPRAAGGSTLTHSVKIATRGWMGQLLAHIEVNVKGRKPLDRIYRRIDDIVRARKRRYLVADPFMATKPPAAGNVLRHKLDFSRDHLLQQGLDTECVDRLLEFLGESPAQEIARLRPRVLAQRLQVHSSDLAAVCLECCQTGLLELHWDVLCPTCRASAQVKDHLNELDRHAHCEACELDFDVDLAKSVEMIFRAHPEFRRADLKTYCIGGPEHSPHVIAQTRLAPGETVELDLHLDPGSYILRGPQLPYAVRIISEVGIDGVGHAHLPLGPHRDTIRPLHLPAGRQRIVLESQSAHSLVVRLERAAIRGEAFTAAEALRLPAFQRLFPDEVIARDHINSVSTSTFVGVRVTNLLNLFAQWGDGQTCLLVGQALNECRTLLEAYGGKLLKDEDDYLLFSFPVACEAVQAGLILHNTIESRKHPNGPQLRLVMHRGITMSSSFSGRSDSFGRAVSQAKRLLEADTDGMLLISDDLAQDETVHQLLSESGQNIFYLGMSGDVSLFSLSRTAPQPSRSR